MHTYDELSVRIAPAPVEGSYRAHASGAAGDESGEFVVPFQDMELDNFVLRVGRTRRSTRRLESPEMAYAKDFGGRLFDALFSDRLRHIYLRSRAQAASSGKGMRVSLKLSDAPELLALPWEYLFDDPDFLSISTQTPIVRYLDLPAPHRPLLVEPPLRILGMVSNPEETVQLAVDEERSRLEAALRRLIDEGLVELHWTERPTLTRLQRELRERSHHVFHFIGHGGFDERSQDGLLLLEDEHGRSRAVTGWQLGTILRDHTSLRLAVLNACEGARSASHDPFAGVASGLVQREIPAVIAMQFEVTDRAAVIFADELYAALVNSYPVDAALAETRKAIFADGNDIEWGTPTLFLRVPDGRLFTFQRPAASKSAHGTMVPSPPPPPAGTTPLPPWPDLLPRPKRPTAPPPETPPAPTHPERVTVNSAGRPVGTAGRPAGRRGQPSRRQTHQDVATARPTRSGRDRRRFGLRYRIISVPALILYTLFMVADVVRDVVSKLDGNPHQDQIGDLVAEAARNVMVKLIIGYVVALAISNLVWIVVARATHLASQQ